MYKGQLVWLLQICLLGTQLPPMVLTSYMNAPISAQLLLQATSAPTLSQGGGFLSKSRSSCLLSAPLSCQGEIKQNRTFSPQNKGVGPQRDSAAAVMAISETEKTLEGAAVGSSRDDLGRAKFIITSPHFHLLIPPN